MSPNTKLTEGMAVYSSDGERLGKIVSCQSDGFTVEKGLFLPKASQFRYSDVSDVREGAVHLFHERSKLADERFWTERQGGTLGQMEATASRAEYREPQQKVSDEVRVQLAEEELSADKRIRDIGEVRIHKRVVVSQKQITVPIMHEEVVIERVPMDASTQLSADAFREASFSVPLHEEELDLHTRPIVREEVRIKRRALQEDRTASADIRREEIDIEQPKYSASTWETMEKPAMRH